jgi:outer membrane lipoprotein-sorting protein
MEHPMAIFRTIIGAAVMALTLALSPIADAADAKRAQLSAQDRVDIARAQDALNAIDTLKARFLQISSNGGQAEGTAYLHRPGRLRLQYDPPSPLLVVADGTFLIVHDNTLGNPSYIPLGSTPAGVLVRNNVQLDGKDLAVTHVSHQPGVIAITVVQAEDSGDGQLTLVFTDRPFQLRQWRVVDPQGQTTTVSLYDVETGLALDSKLFEFKDPNFGRPKL